MSTPVRFTPTKQFFDPGTVQEYPSRESVTLYFIGYQLLEHNKTLGPINIKGRLYYMPAIGESLVVPDNVARDLENRLTMYSPKLGHFSAVTRDASLARAVKRAYEAGTLSSEAPLDVFRDLVQANAVESMTTELLEAELSRRNANTVASTDKKKEK